ncbi:ABC transporter ATP-binding protein [Phocaeicola sp. KGMB11183]|jgi:subfamily B ATP-binding cassette protein MsbA|uniref:ABC transporter ATP-binding protein n=1 Tax=Phocaeicola acetigenes TaxID=3016083 RepID=A0ABT4PJX7_9BACT|nr:ABC transporter ATP-binding protein [Phocaeicola sp. KGMB11183]MCZ8373356.1 ABC transporter ATP-binding protein [Phocaeicola sp. KGMB11183]
MKEFFQMMRRFISPYKKYVFGAIILNILSAIFNVFSFSLLIPILNILFKTSDAQVVYQYMEWGSGELKDVAINNFYYYVSQLIEIFGPATTLLWLGLFLAGMTLLKTACYFGSTAIMVPLRTGVVRDIRIMVYSKVMYLPLSFLSEERKGDIIARMSGDVGEIENSITSSLDMILKNPILILSYFTTLVITSWQLTLFTIIVLPAMGWVMGRVGRKLKRQSLEAQNKWSETMSQLEETLGGMRIIKAFIAEEKMIQRFVKCSNEYRDAVNRVAMRQSLAHPVSEFLGTVLIVLVLWFGGSLILNASSTINASTFIFYMVILYSVINPLKDLSKASYNIPRGLASMERVDKILKAPNNIVERPDAVHIHEMKEGLEFRHISFSYGTHEVLHDVSLHVRKGETIALVGQSGSGKSTLVDLVPRFHDVQQGEILIDGINIKDVQVMDLRGLIGNVNQEAILFNDSFFNNIAFGVENATMEQVIEAAKIANAHDFIMETEKGYDTNIGDRGCRLSGGQRQRISIARAILKNPAILILDEATSALDTESERLVQEALERLMKTRTTIAIAHRLSTIKNADRIYVLYEGRIVESGKHDELVQKNGYYKRLHDMQAL